ncbi:MAG: universal stress protein [Moorea sp. SIO2B7]|nr:universal stress protein [Moorena sp. SIO2B7]
MIKNILLADSGTEKSEEMLKSLMDLPSLKGASITILNVVSAKSSTEDITAKMEEGGRLLGKAIEKLKLDPNQVSTILRQGEPKDTVLKVADEIDANLIIMGSRALGRLEAILSNSVSQYVFQLTNRPMLLIKDDIYVKKLKRVMVGLDKSEAAQYCLDLALFMLRDSKGCELLLTRVNPDLAPNLKLSKEDMEKNPIIAPAVAKAKRQGIPYRCVVTGGRPGKQLCNLAEEYNIDLLIIGSPDRRPSIAKSLPNLELLLGTSLSDYVRVKTPCPLLLARKEVV